ncbi:MAG: CHASE domain-containing protein [Burkholderiales bacterium]
MLASKSKTISTSNNLTALFAKAPPWLVLVLALISTLVAWYATQTDSDVKADHAFQLHAEKITTEIRARLDAYEQVLRGGVGLFAVNNALTRTQWHDYVSHLRLAESFPGIQGVGFTKVITPDQLSAHVAAVRAEGYPDYDVRPAGPREIYASIIYLEPFSGSNLRAFGYDTFSEPVRRAAMERARDSGNISATGKLKLVQEDGEKLQAGFILYAAIYRNGKIPATVEQRRSELLGYVSAPFRIDDFMAGLSNLPADQVQLKIYDGTQPTPDTLLFDNSSNRETASAMLSHHTTLQAAGRPWSLAFSLAAELLAGYSSALPNTILGGGTLISLLLFAIAQALTNQRAKAEAIAKDMTEALRESESRMTGIIGAAMEAIISVDDKQHVIMFNAAAENVFRCKAEDAIGSPLSCFLPERFRAAHHQHVERFGATGTSERRMGKQLALYGLRADGEEFPIEASISQIEQYGKKLYTVMLRDITQRKIVEQELEASRKQLRELAVSVQKAREEEKSRIARELHDDLGQQLTALKMDLSWLAHRVPKEVALAEKIQAMQALTNSSVTSLRRIASDLRPTMLDDLGLAPAIEWLTQDFAQRSGVKVHLNIGQHSQRLNKDAETAVYRIVQESLTNVTRHAKATNVFINMAYNEKRFSLTVRDDGIGLAPGSARKGKSFGLLGMKERVHVFGGTIYIAGQSDGGTTIEVVLPASVIQEEAQ